MLLSKPAILRHLEAGKIIIDPFDEKNVGTSSYDVALGEHYFREQDPGGGLGTFNIYSESDVRRVWGEPQKAQPLENWLAANGYGRRLGFYGIEPTDLVIWIAPGQTILCHTREFIGGRSCITTEMKARSSLGRVFIEVCKCAGMGDVGYINRWTMEVTNNSIYYHVPLVVGRRIAQIVFFEVEPLSEDYAREGKYQTDADLWALRNAWRPEDMLPKLFRDRETLAAEERRRLNEMIEEVERPRGPRVMHAFPPASRPEDD